MPSWIGPWEIVIVVVIILLIFGGRLLPRIGRSLGGSVTSLKKGLKEGSDEFRDAVREDEATEPAKAEASKAEPAKAEPAKAASVKTPVVESPTTVDNGQ